mmetsp:Transcript_25209/g.72290  ORF Transcript_25209/g.72290 Transcript_25209/m.72290 type:complete len:212 (+) Transcript_25209:500-1135(+)
MRGTQPSFGIMRLRRYKSPRRFMSEKYHSSVLVTHCRSNAQPELLLLQAGVNQGCPRNPWTTCSRRFTCTASELTAAAAAAAVSSDAVHVNRLEHVVQGFLGQPWFTPAWSNNSSGWAFDLQWVTSTLEWYFSDMNLRGDLYLRSLMMPNEGWVPLMLLQAFPRLQALGVDHAVLGQAAMVSSSLELDTTGHYTRIRDKNRRAQWLPVRTG